MTRAQSAWRRFGGWRRSRPFWGGLLLVLAGVEVFATTQMSLDGLSLQLGPTGFLSWLVPTMLVACGLLAWFTPQQRLFYAIVGAVTAVFSLVGVNLGGFLLGVLLGVVGAGLVFAWVPARAAAPVAGSDVDGATTAAPAVPRQAARAGDDVPVDHLLDDDRTGETAAAPPVRPQPAPSTTHGAASSSPAPAAGNPTVPLAPAPPATDRPGTSSPPDRPAAGPPAGPAPSPVTAGPAQEPATQKPPLPRREAPRLYSIALLLALAATMLVAVRPAGPAQAAPTPCPTTGGKPGAKPATEPGAKPPAKPAAGAQPTPGASRSRGIIGQIVDGILDIFDGDDRGDGDGDTRPSATPSPVKPGAKPSPPQTRTQTRPAACPTPIPTGSPIPKIAADPGQPRVNAVPSRLTGTKVTMNDLEIAGIVDLPTADGTIRAIKFTMSRSTVDDFVLTIPQGEDRRPLVIESSALTVRGDVSFYASRFVGWILGIKLTLTPSSPLLPEGGIPLSLPVIAFDRPEMQLVFVDCDVLTAPDLDESFPDAG